MLPRDSVPTRLIPIAERIPIQVEPAEPPGRYRGWFVTFELLKLGARVNYLRWTRRLNPKKFAALVREVFKQLGPLWIQSGKFMAMRSDLIPPEFSRELAQLRDHAPGFPFEDAKKVVEAELGTSIERYFDEFHQRPFAASSNFQLHRARLRREQVWVAVKVQRPNADKIVENDLSAIRRVTWWLSWLKVQPKMRWHDLYREIEEQLTRELDLRYEASALQQLSHTMPHHHIHVPHVFSEYSGRRVLVMEFISGALLSDYLEIAARDPERASRWREANNIEPRKVARRLFHSVWRQIFEDNFFHADMHAGNVILLKDNRLAIIDCRSVGFMEVDQLRKQRMFYKALARTEFATAAEHSFLLAFRLPVVDLGEVKSQFVRVWRRWESRNYVRDLPSETKSLTQMLDELNRIMRIYGFEVQWSMAKLAWAIINADTSILPLSSRINYLKWLQSYFRLADYRSNRINQEDLQERAVYMWDSGQEMPRLIVESSVAQQEVTRRQAQVIQGSIYKSSLVLSTLHEFMAVGCLLALIGTTGMYLYQYGGDSGRSFLEFWLGRDLVGLMGMVGALHRGWWIFLTVVLCYGLISSVILKRRSLQTDVPSESRLPLGAQ